MIVTDHCKGGGSLKRRIGCYVTVELFLNTTDYFETINDILFAAHL